MITRKDNPNAEQYDKHLLTFRDVSEDIKKLADDYRTQMLLGVAIAAVGLILFVILFGLVIASGFMRWFFIILGLAVTAFGGLHAYKMKSFVDLITTTAKNASNGNFTISEDRIVKKWAYNEKIGLNTRLTYCVRTITQNQPVDIPAVVYQHAIPGDVIYLVHTPSIEGILYAYLGKSTDLDKDLIERTVKYDTRNDEALSREIAKEQQT